MVCKRNKTKKLPLTMEEFSKNLRRAFKKLLVQTKEATKAFHKLGILNEKIHR
jgi:hypothetical protein